jgi:hypothetical protein
MSFLISIDKKNKQLLHPEVLKLVDSFEALNEKEMLFVVLFADYSSPFKQFPEHERKRKAMWEAFDDNENKLIESKRIQDAIQDYISLQYNPKIEVARKYQQKIDKLLELLEVDDSASGIKKTTDAIASLRVSIRALEDEVEEQQLNEGVVKGKMTLSFLEKIMANQKHFKAVTAKK